MTTTAPTIPELLELRAGSPRGMTFWDSSGKSEHWSYGDLRQIAARFAGAYAGLGIQPGDRVALFGSTTPGLVAAIFGCWAAGAVAVPLAVPLRITDIESIAEEVTLRLDRSQSTLLAIDPELQELAGQAGITTRMVSFDDLRERGREVALTRPQPDDLALIQFTSGSTSQPKGVMLSHHCLLANGYAAREHLHITTDDTTASWLPLYHDFGLIGATLWPIVMDMACNLMAPETFLSSPRRWAEMVHESGATITAAPNFAYGLAARVLRATETKLDLSRLRIAANGAEPIDPQTVADFLEAAAPHGLRPEAMLPVYGLAEATLGVASPDPGHAPEPMWVDAAALADRRVVVEVEAGSPGARPLVAVGQPMPGVQVEIRDDGERVADGHVGEIFVRSDYAMLGYYEDPDATTAVVQDGWLATGDLGVWTRDGLVITGRLKDMIIVGGRNVYPEDAERIAEKIPGVRRGNAVAFASRRRGRESLVVIAETRESGDAATKLAADVARAVRRALQVGVDDVVLVEPGTLPKTPSGKLQRGLTRKRYEEAELGQPVASMGGNPASSRS